MEKWNILLSRKHRLDGDIQKKPSASGVKKVCFLLCVKQKRKVVVGKSRQLLNVQNQSKHKERGIFMKKGLSLILVLVLCLGLCACGSKTKYVGTYESRASVLASVSESYKGSTLYKSELVYGTRTITLNSDGTGTIHFTTTENVNPTNKAVFDETCNGTLTWNVDGDYLTITFNEITYEDINHPGFMSDTRREVAKTITFELKGAQLVSVSGSWTYTKVN